MRAGYFFCQYCCYWACVLLLKARFFNKYHLPRKGAVLVVANHQSFMDPVLAMVATIREGNFMARESLFQHPFFGRLIYYLGAFPVRRGTADIGAIKEAMRRLKQGKVVVLFPEGTRSLDGRIQELMPGFGAIAKKAKVPIVPVLIDGMAQAWPRTQPLPSSGDVIVEYGEPISPEDFAGMTADELMVEVGGRLHAMQHSLHQRMPERRLPWYEETAQPVEEL